MKKHFLVGAFFVFFFVRVAHAIVVIDDFFDPGAIPIEDPLVVVAKTVMGTTHSEYNFVRELSAKDPNKFGTDISGVTSAIGGYRSVYLVRNAGISVSAFVSQYKTFQFDPSSDVDGHVRLLYNADGEGLGQGKGVDITESGTNTAIEINMFSRQLGEYPCVVILTDASDGICITNAFEVYRGLSGVILDDAKGVDLKRIVSIQFVFNPPDIARDFELNYIRALRADWIPSK